MATLTLIVPDVWKQVNQNGTVSAAAINSSFMGDMRRNASGGLHQPVLADVWSGSAMYCEIHTDGIEQRAQARELAELLTIYMTVAPPIGAPDKAAFGKLMLERMMPFLMVLEPLDNGEFRYLHYGSGISAISGFDMTGKTTADFDSPIGALFRDIYIQASALQRPVYTIIRAAIAANVHTWERLILPVRQEDGRIGFLVYNRPREFQNDFLRTVFHLITDGVFAIRAVRDNRGPIRDLRIVAANPAAATMLKQPMDKLIDGSMLELFSGIVPSGVWDRMIQVIETRQSTLFETHYVADGISGWFRNNFAPLEDGLVVQLTDITDLKNVAASLEIRQAELTSELETRVRQEKTLRALADTDALTGLPNRRGLHAAAEALAADATSSGTGLVGVVADIDNFKTINDRYGHSAGDLVLQQIGSMLREWCEENGAIAARLGGEEFALLMPGDDVEGIKQRVERLRVMIAVRPVATPAGPICLT
ncbi:MAG: diguanylate cyclase domain-containing protein, partial [Bosea sp. (in: a-proteobacteria)]